MTKSSRPYTQCPHCKKSYQPPDRDLDEELLVVADLAEQVGRTDDANRLRRMSRTFVDPLFSPTTYDRLAEAVRSMVGARPDLDGIHVQVRQATTDEMVFQLVLPAVVPTGSDVIASFTLTGHQICAARSMDKLWEVLRDGVERAVADLQDYMYKHRLRPSSNSAAGGLFATGRLDGVTS